MENEKNLIDNRPSTNISDGSAESQPNAPEMVNHPGHYNNYDIEVIDMMEKIWGTKMVAEWCLLTSYKYRMRMGTKPGETFQRDLEKERWYLNKYQDLIKKLENNK